MARALSMNITQAMLVDIGRPGPIFVLRQLVHVDGRSHLGICVSWLQYGSVSL